MKTRVKILIGINLALTMLFISAVDSLSNMDLLKYGAMLALLWYSVKCIARTENNNQETQQQCNEERDTE